MPTKKSTTTRKASKATKKTARAPKKPASSKIADQLEAAELRNADLQGQISAIGKAQAVIEFNMDGTIITANDNFLNALGYRLDEVQGKHHSMFVEMTYGASPEYREFWAKLNRGEYIADEFKRISKGGKEVWIQASYNPILDLNGKPFKVVKYATDVTEQKLRNADFQGQIGPISKAQAVIEFNMDGTIITANDNFLGVLGYTLEEVQGKHHRMFVEDAFAASDEYKAFWEKLNRGEYQAAEYLRLGKGGREVWIQASYNPILDLNGKPFKVVKYATDITEQKLATKQTVENLSTPVIITDADFNITYMNPISLETLKTVAQYLPCPAEEIVGKNVDFFHKNPAYQRGILGNNGAKLPTRTIIEVGPEKLDLEVTAIRDSKDDLVGAMATWSLVTQKLKAETEQQRLESMVENSPTPVILADADFNITYMNPVSLATLEKVAQYLPCRPDEIVGKNVDFFHKNPSYQRGLLGNDGANLPTQAIIEVGPEKLDLLVTAIKNEKGEFLGPMVTWSLVTEKLKAETEQQRLESMVENSPTPVILADADFNITYMNPVSLATLEKVAQYLPCRPDEIVGKNVDFFHKNPSYQRGLLGNNGANLPTQAIIEVGPEKLDLLVSAIKNEKGEFLGPMVTWSLVTEKLKAETEQQRLQSMVENSPTPVILADADFNITYMNPVSLATLEKVAQYLPCRPDEIVGKNVDFFHKNPSYQRGLLGNNGANLPTQAIIEVGPEKLDLLVSAIKNDKGEFLGPMVTWSLVTAKLKAETEQARMQAMIENAPTNIILADKDLNITYVNPATVKNLAPLAHLLPIPIDQIVGSSIDIFHKNPSYQRNLLRDPSNLPRQAVIELGDQKLDLLVSAIRDQNGEYMGPMVTWVNITEKLHLEERTKLMTEEARQKEADLQEKVESLLVTVNAAAKGDLTVPITVSGEDAVGRLADSLSAMIGNIKNLIGEISQSIDQVGQGAAQVSAASQQLAEGASEQASSLEETSAALEQMTAMVRTNAESASNADGLSNTARTAAVDGAGIMDRLQDTMKGITDASEKISKIIKVIEEIAFQTNLLALNAAVEAARAGEHGKGFAVVAEEVRNLAQRSAQAAKDTTDLIENSVAQAKEGTSVTVEAAKSLQSIVDNISQVAELITGINTASTEQSQGVEQINTAVSQMDKVTQQNASGAEESASAAEQMNAQMVSLKEMCEQFKVSNDEQPHSTGTGRQGSSMNPSNFQQHGQGGKGNNGPGGTSRRTNQSKGEPMTAVGAGAGNHNQAADEFMSSNDDGIKGF